MVLLIWRHLLAACQGPPLYCWRTGRLYGSKVQLPAHYFCCRVRSSTGRLSSTGAISIPSALSTMSRRIVATPTLWALATLDNFLHCSSVKYTSVLIFLIVTAPVRW